MAYNMRTPDDSLLSGSQFTRNPRSNLSGVASAIQKTYENYPMRTKSNQSLNSQISGRNERSLYHIGSEKHMSSKPVISNQSLYGPHQMKLSRSLRASKASMATYRSGRTTIQAEHHDRKVQRELGSVKFGRARKLFWISVACYIMFLVVLFVGLLVTCLRFIYMNIILSLDLGEMIGPVLIAGSFIFLGLGLKFYIDADRIGCEERSRIKYKAASPSTVAATTVNERIQDTKEELISGGASKNALTRAPIGSRTTLNIQ